MSIIGIICSFFVKYYLIANYKFLITIIVISCILYTTLKFYRSGFKPAKLYLVSMLPLWLITVLLVLNRWDIFPELIEFDYSMEFGSIWMVLFMSLAQADRVNLLNSF